MNRPQVVLLAVQVSDFEAPAWVDADLRTKALWRQLLEPLHQAACGDADAYQEARRIAQTLKHLAPDGARLAELTRCMSAAVDKANARTAAAFPS